METTISTVSLLENHEQQYAILSADITSKIGKLSSYTGSINLTVSLYLKPIYVYKFNLATTLRVITWPTSEI